MQKERLKEPMRTEWPAVAFDALLEYVGEQIGAQSLQYVPFLQVATL